MHTYLVLSVAEHLLVCALHLLGGLLQLDAIDLDAELFVFADI